MGRRILCGLAIAVAAASLCRSNEPTPQVADDLPAPEQVAARLAEGLKQKLELTEQQMPAVEAALLKMLQRQRETLSAQATGGTQPLSLRALMRQVESSQTEAKESLRDVLGPEQLAGFDSALRDQRCEAIGEAMTRRLQEPLLLSAEQRERIAGLYTEHARAYADLLDKHSSNGRPYFGASRAMRDRAVALQQELERAVADALTPEQFAKYNEIVAEARRSRGGPRSAAPR